MDNTALESTSWKRAALDELRTGFAPINPIVLFFGILGILHWKNCQQRNIFILTISIAVILGVIGPIFKPQLELNRMLVVLGMILVLPASGLIAEFLSHSPRESKTHLIFTAIFCGTLSITPLWLWKITSNQTTERYSTADTDVEELVTVIKQHSQGGRTLFAGFVLHELSLGHIAPLAAWTNEPLIASSYQHDRWRYTEVMPVEYREGGESGIMEYLSLMNVSSILTHNHFWNDWFSARPHLFEKVWQGKEFRLFISKNFNSNYFLNGVGEVIQQTGNSIQLKVNSKEAIIKFNYLPLLESSNCQLEPFPVSKSITFVKLYNCIAGSHVEVKAANIFKRFFQ